MRTATLVSFLWCLAWTAGCGGPYLRPSTDPVGDLGSSDPNVAALAALSIASSEDPALRAQAVDPLCRLLGHRDPLVRSAAARALEAVTGVEQGYRAFRDPQDEAARIDSWRAVAERSLRGSLDP